LRFKLTSLTKGVRFIFWRNCYTD